MEETMQHQFIRECLALAEKYSFNLEVCIEVYERNDRISYGPIHLKKDKIIVTNKFIRIKNVTLLEALQFYRSEVKQRGM